MYACSQTSPIAERGSNIWTDSTRASQLPPTFGLDAIVAAEVIIISGFGALVATPVRPREGDDVDNTRIA